MKAVSRDFHLETREGSSTTLALSAHMSFRHDWQGFENILLAKILSEVRGRGLLHDEQRGFGPTTNQTHHCNWPAWLKEYRGTSATSGSQARSSSL